MCLLWCYNTLRRDGCKGICPDCACVSCVAVFVLAPVGFVGGLLYALLLGLAKLWLGASPNLDSPSLRKDGVCSAAGSLMVRFRGSGCAGPGHSPSTTTGGRTTRPSRPT